MNNKYGYIRQMKIKMKIKMSFKRLTEQFKGKNRIESFKNSADVHVTLLKGI